MKYVIVFEKVNMISTFKQEAKWLKKKKLSGIMDFHHVKTHTAEGGTHTSIWGS